MGLDMELEFEKYCVVDGSPKTVLPSPRRCSKVEKGKPKEKCGNDILIQNEDFLDISFSSYCSASCKSIYCRTKVLETNKLLKRSSLYQSSKEVRKMEKMGYVEERSKIELSLNNGTGFSFGIVDSLCSLDEDSYLVEENRSSEMSVNSESSISVSKPQIETSSPDFLDLPFQPVAKRGCISSDGLLESSSVSDERENQSAENTERESVEEPKCRFDPSVSPLSDRNGLWERDPAFTLHKSQSAKLALPHLSSRYKSDCSKLSSPKTRFSPIRKMFDPFVKSKCQKSPLGSSIRPFGISRSKTLRKSLLRDFSNTLRTECESQFVKKEYLKSPVPCSPAHLHGLLKLENKHGVPFFEFTVKVFEEVFVAKTWKVGNALNWVYTFHAVHNKSKSSASAWGLKDVNKESSVVGQMQVSCYLCTELKDAGAFDNSMVTEFVLYDIAQARKNVADHKNSCSSPDVEKPLKVSNENSIEVSDQTKLKPQPKHASDDLSTHPRAQEELQPNLEIAAIVIQVPFEKRESLKCKRGDRKSDQPLPELVNLSRVDRRERGISDCFSPAKVNVVTPSGNHSLPATESRGPSPLLDRWRLGGGCDCGGWDMGCPLLVFGNPNIQYAEDHLLMENQLPLELFVQGSKEKTPAVTMIVTKEGQYAVDFHAQLTTLQAFSICVAILHGTESSIAAEQEREKKLLQCDSLRVFIGEEVKYLIEAVTEEEKKKASKKMEETPPSFILNPPFSPIARV